MVEVPGSEFDLDVDLVLLALGFLHPQKEGMIEQLAVELDPRGNVKTDVDKMTSVPGVFAAGDMARGQSLVVWAIAEGRQAAYGIDKWLMGESDLPSVNLQGWA
jgi:glutamate synthase (NADPH/NADH) small chain